MPESQKDTNVADWKDQFALVHVFWDLDNKHAGSIPPNAMVSLLLPAQRSAMLPIGSQLDLTFLLCYCRSTIPRLCGAPIPRQLNIQVANDSCKLFSPPQVARLRADAEKLGAVQSIAAYGNPPPLTGCAKWRLQGVARQSCKSSRLQRGSRVRGANRAAAAYAVRNSRRKGS